MSASSERDAARAKRTGVAVSAAMLAPAAPVLGLPPEGPLPHPQLAGALARGLIAALVLSAAVLATQVEAVRHCLLRRVHVVRATARRSSPPRRSRAGGGNDRVPPRSAAGSPSI